MGRTVAMHTGHAHVPIHEDTPTVEGKDRRTSGLEDANVDMVGETPNPSHDGNARSTMLVN